MLGSFGIYQDSWRHSGIRDLVKLAAATTAGTAAAMLVVLLMFRFEGYSRAVFAIHWLLATSFLCGSRVLFRALGEVFVAADTGGPRTVIYGAGAGGVMVLREARSNGGPRLDGHRLHRRRPRQVPHERARRAGARQSRAGGAAADLRPGGAGRRLDLGRAARTPRRADAAVRRRRRAHARGLAPVPRRARGVALRRPAPAVGVAGPPRACRRCAREWYLVRLAREQRCPTATRPRAGIRRPCFHFSRRPRIDHGQDRAHHGHHRTGRLVPRRAAALEGLPGRRRHPPAERAESLAHRPPAGPDHAAAGRPARPAVAHQGDRRGRARRGLQPGGDVVRAGVVGPADADRRVQRAGRDAGARSHPPGQPEDQVLPGLVERDVRQGARGAAERADAVLPAQPLRRVEGLRPLHHGQLPRELRPVRLLGHSLQPRVAAPRPRVRDPQGHRRRGPHQARARATRCISATSTPSATGASRATTCARCG